MNNKRKRVVVDSYFIASLVVGCGFGIMVAQTGGTWQGGSLLGC